MATIKIAVPEDLKRRMGEVVVNWSVVAAQAFEDLLDRLELVDWEVKECQKLPDRWLQ